MPVSALLKMGQGMTQHSTQMNKPNTDDLRIKEIKELVPPAHVFREYPVSARAAQSTFAARQAIHRVLHGADDRLLVVIGPCSIHDYDLAMDYAKSWPRKLKNTPKTSLSSCASISKSRAPRWAGRA